MDRLAVRAWNGEIARLWVALALLMSASQLCAVGLAYAASAPISIIELTGDLNPEYSQAQEPSAQQLIETWRSSNKLMPGKRVDLESFEILDRRVVQGKYPRAFLQFRILPPQGDALAFARTRCPGRKRPVEIQVFYQWSDYIGAWVAYRARGAEFEDLCSNDPLWTADWIARLLNPPPLPAPPRISPAEVVTPRPGSPERSAIMNALRPRYEEAFGPPIVFRVETLRVAAGFAFVLVHPQRPNGAPIEQSVWRKAFREGCYQDPTNVSNEYWMKLEGGAWKIGVKNDVCASDSILQEGDLIGAPPQLIGNDAWREREFPPELYDDE